MSGNIGRNDPCPCGSGKKYKKCCLRKDQEEERRIRSQNEALETVVYHLHHHHRDPTLRAMAEGFFGHYDPEIEGQVDDLLPPSLAEIVWSNAYEWLAADAKIEVDGTSRGAVELALGEAELPLDGNQRLWLEGMAERSLGLYRVERVEEGKGLWVQDVGGTGEGNENGEALFVADPLAGNLYGEEALIGLRLVSHEDRWQPTVAFYLFDESDEEALLAAIEAGRHWAEEAGEDVDRAAQVSQIVIERWLTALFEPDEGGDADEDSDESV